MFQAQFLAQTAERIFSAVGWRLGDTRPLASRSGRHANAASRHFARRLQARLNLNAAEHQNRSASRRASLNPKDPDPQHRGSASAWMTGLGGTGRRHRAGGAEQVFGGLALGTERLLRPDVLGGVYTGVLLSDQTRHAGGRHRQSQGHFVGLYGRLEKAETLIDLDIGLAYQRHEHRRRVLENGTVRSARADYRGWLVGAGLGVGQRVSLGAGRTFTPVVRLRYSGSFDQGYSERGSAANLTVDGGSTHLLEGRLQGLYRQELAFTSGVGHLQFSLGAVARRAWGNDRFSGRVFGQRFSHRLSGQANREYGGEVAWGIGIPVSDTGTLFGRVAGVFLGGEDYDLSAVVGVQVQF